MGTSYFERFFVDGGPLVWFVLFPLSIVTVSLIVRHYLTIRRGRLLPGAVVGKLERLARQGDAVRLRAAAGEAGDLLSRALQVVLGQAAGGVAAMENAIYDALEQQAMGLRRRIEWLHIIGNIAPMIGLFGTVWGMIEAFHRIVVAQGQPEAEELAGALSIAMVTTLWGLLAAIPALAAYGSLRNRIEGLTADAAVAAGDFLPLASVMSGQEVGQ